MNWLVVGILLFVEVVIYFQSKSDAKYRKGCLFLVSIPVSAYASREVRELCRKFERENLRNYLLITLLLLPVLFLSGVMSLVSIMIWLAALLIGANLALRKYRRQLKALKKRNSWSVKEESTIHHDAPLAILAEKGNVRRILLVIPLALDSVLLGWGIVNRQPVLAVSAVLMMLMLGVGSSWILRLPDALYTTDADLNVKLNRARRKSGWMALLYLGCGDAVFLLGLCLLDWQFTVGLICFAIAAAALILAASSLLSFSRFKERMLRFHEEPFCAQDPDETWRVGLLGAVYDNPADPRTLVLGPNGAQMIFNAAKPGYRWFMLSLLIAAMVFFGSVFGYPYYLDQRHELADLTLTKTTLRVDSPFYEREWALESIEKVEWSEDLGGGIRIHGTDTGIYAKGHYRFDRYGDCEVYLASLHPAYLLCYTREGLFIVNADDLQQTKAVYQQLADRVND